MSQPTRLLLLVACFSATSLARADVVADARAYVDKGLQAYVASGPKAFLEYTVKGGALEGNPQTLSQANTLQQIQDIGGKPTAYEIVSTTKLSERSVELLYVVYLEKAAVFGTALIYRTPDGGLTTQLFNFNTLPDKVWPQARVYGAP
jgi:hypothetical protein